MSNYVNVLIFEIAYKYSYNVLSLGCTTKSTAHDSFTT
jgi:hypothetical protein